MKELQGQLTFNEVIKEQNYFIKLSILQSMHQGQEITLNDIKIKKTQNGFDLGNMFYLSVHKLAADIVIGFNYKRAKCKWINGESVPWEVLE